MKTIFLLGAGASRPAGIPAIDGMTKSFLKQPVELKRLDKNSQNKIRNLTPKINTLKKVAKNRFDKVDLETLMSLIVKLEDKKDKELLVNAFPNLKKIGTTSISLIKSLIQDYIRKKCENIRTVEYFAPLQGLKPPNEPLNIFTLNYDGTIEIFCERNNITCIDGFNPRWEPTDFNENKVGVNLFKLHGSLYWFKRESGNYIKVPIKGLRIAEMRYLTDESVSEMMIYPQLEKDKESAVYSTLSQRFKDALNESEICVIIGYSFRDEYIRKNIIEYLSLNPKLWLVIVSPHANKHKNDYFAKNREFPIRVVTMNIGIEEALRNGKLNDFLFRITNGRNQEEPTENAQLNTASRLDSDWRFILRNYLMIEHHDRTKWIVEKLFEKNFTNVSGSFPEIIEADVYPQSLQYLMEYYLKRNHEKVTIWKDIFVRASAYFEYVYFQQNPELRDHNPINRSELPIYVQSFQSFPENTLNELKETANQIQQKIVDGSLKQNINKLIQTIDLITYKEYTNPEKTGYRLMAPQEFLTRYNTNDLGLEKWSKEIVNKMN